MHNYATQKILQQLDALILFRRKIKSGVTVYQSGSRFKALYMVKSGLVKTETILEDGRIQITGFYMSGEIVGFDGIATDFHTCTSIALDDSEICTIPFDGMNQFSQSPAEIKHHFFKLMSREIVRNHGMMLLLGSMFTEERVAVFLLNLSERLYARGYSPLELKLRMRREEIASFLGMKIETLSRILSKFQDQGLLEVHQKIIRIIDINELKNAIDKHQAFNHKESRLLTKFDTHSSLQQAHSLRANV